MVAITYVLVIPVDGGASPFQGWADRVINGEFKELLIAAATGPSDTAEIFMSHDELRKFRSNAHRKIIVAINSNLLEEIYSLVSTPLAIVLAPPEVVPKISALSLTEGAQLIVATTESVKNSVDLSRSSARLSAHVFDYEIYKAIRHIRSSKNIKSKMPKMRTAYSTVSSCTFYGSGSTVANELVLASLGYKVSKERAYINPLEIENFFRAISESAEAILLATNDHREDGGEVILYSPAIVGYLYDVNSNFWNQLLRGIKRPLHKDFIKNGLIKNPDYSGYIVNQASTEDDHPYKDPMVVCIVKIRQKELIATNFSVGLLASSISAPALRLPNSVNLHRAKLKSVEETQKRRDDKSRKQLQLKFKELSLALESAFCERFRYLITSKVKNCTICSDAPLEWAYLTDLPLMISHEISRVPMTPGNMLLQLACIGSGVNINSASVRDILVIRSFRDTDKLRPMFESAVKNFQISDNTSIRFVDVATVDGVITCLNDFNGAMVIFDCHGNHQGAEGIGWLEIGDEKLNSWELHGKAKIPPIVALSACSTSALSGSYVSVANGFLRSGALSVMGTFLQVDGVLSSAFFARIIWRIDLFLSAIKSMGYKTLTWRTFISGFLRMSYSTDVLRHFEESGVISSKDYQEIHIAVNFKINSLSDDWYSYLVGEVSTKSGVHVEDLRMEIKNNTPLMETMFYCQLGRPDLINIVL